LADCSESLIIFANLSQFEIKLIHVRHIEIAVKK
jgi:hypothetical protein